VPDRATYLRSAPGYTMSDGGAALLVRRVETAEPEPTGTADDVRAATAAGILASAFSASSEHWDVGTLPGGGTRHPRDLERTYFDIDGARLRDAFLALGPATVLEA